MGRLANKNYHRKLTPDLVYNSELVAKLINYVMRKGKKELATKIVYEAFEIIKKETKQIPLKIFDKAIENVMPTVELRSRRIGGANYQVPCDVSEHKKIIYALRWIVLFAKKKKHHDGMAHGLAKEIIDSSKNTGESIKKKETVHKIAKANIAFAHYRW